MAELTVAAGLARGLIDVCVSRGASSSTLAKLAGIDVKDLEDQDNRIRFKNYVELMRAGKELCNDPALGLHFGEVNDLAQVSVVGLLGDASETVAESLAQLSRYGRLVIEFDGGPDRFRLAHERGGLWLVDNRQNPNDFPELTESTFARFVCGARRHGHLSMLKQVHVTHVQPDYRAEYDRIFQKPITFSSDWNAMQIDPAVLTTRIQPQPRYVFGVLSDRADMLLKELENSKSTCGRVESLLMPVLHTGELSMDSIAEKMALSRQTLFRKLKEEGATFEKVLDDLRHKMALSYLGGKKVSVNETAYLVGFSDPTAFSRAFKRWTGNSPRTMRESKIEHKRPGIS
jgi:AraC-like DNA-binding protein